MKKILIPAVALLLILIGVFVYYTAERLEQQQFNADVIKYGATAMETTGITAEIGGETVTLPDWKLDSLVFKLQTASAQRKRVSALPEGVIEQLTLHLGDSCTLELYSLDKAGDSTIVRMDTPGKDYFFQLSGYKLYDWIKKIATQE